MPKVGDFDGDGKAEIVFMGFAAATGNRWVRYVDHRSPNVEIVGTADGASSLPVPGTYDGMPGLDPAWVTDAGDWVSKGAGPPISFPRPGPPGVRPGNVGYNTMPVPGYYDGGTKTIPAWYDEFTGTWTIRGHDPVVFGSGPTDPLGPSGGCATSAYDQDIAVPADYDGDKTTDLAVYNPVTGSWRIRNSVDGLERTLSLGGLGYYASPADYDGDGRVDPAVLDVIGPGAGTWLIDGQPSRTLLGDLGRSLIPASADYSGDGAAEHAAFDTSTGRLYIASFNGYAAASGTAMPATGQMTALFTLLRSAFLATCS